MRCTTAAVLATAVFCVVGMLTVCNMAQADWPTYRADASRSGYTPQELPEELSLRWVHRGAHRPQPAWPRSGRLPFDRAFQPVAAGGAVYFGSSVDGKVYALDAATGQIRWSRFTDGPIRFAPALWQDRLFVASDDGHLYALAADDGRLLWKRRGGPDHERRLGNQRMISKWPARGGPVVVDDVVYFGAGIWPSDGIFLYALDARSGEVLWQDDESGRLYMPQPHGGADAESGISAQGYLLVSGPEAPGAEAESQPPGLDDFRPGRYGPWLLVPTGRAVPAAFDRDSGKFEYFHLQQYGKRGGAPTMAAGSYFFNSGIAFDVQTGQQGHSLGDGLIAATAEGLVRASGQKVTGYRWVEGEKPDRRGNPVRSVGVEPLWSADGVPTGAELIVAGRQVIAGGPQRVTLIDPDQQQPVWSAEVDGTAYGLAVSDGRLLVSTDQGTIYCFEGGESQAEPAVVEAERDRSPYPDDPAIAAAADEILRQFGQQQGYCLDFGCGDGHLAYELARRSQLQIWAVDADAQQVAAARRKLQAAGLYGTRVMVHRVDLERSGYPNFFADLIVSRRALEQGPAALPEAAWQRLLRPAGGVALVGRAGSLQAAERGPLEGAGRWTHQYTNAANTLCSADTRVQGPLGMLWFRDVDVDMPQRHGRGPGPLYDDGRLYAEGLDELVCVNAYNGRVLWKYPLPGILKAYDGDELMGTAGTGSNYCLHGDSVYVRRDDHCLRIDAVSGELLGKFTAPRQPDGEQGTWGYIACEDGLLIGSLANRQHVVTYRYQDRGGDMSKLLTESMTLFAMDAETGELRWRYDAKDSIRHNAIAVGGDTVYLIDRPLALFDRTRTSKPGQHPPGELLALDARSGEPRWSNDQQIDGTMLALSTEHGRLLMSYQPTRFRLVSEVGGRLAVFSTDDGQLQWASNAAYQSRPLINDYTIYAQGGAWDLISGESREFPFSRSYGCGILAGSRHMMFFRSATLGYYDLSGSGETENFGGMRPGCWINTIAAGGLVLVPDASAGCTCSYLNRAWFALEPDAVRVPQIEPAGGLFREPIEVKLAAGPDGASGDQPVQLRYTLDGTTPDQDSPRYEGPIRIPSDVALKARTFAADGSSSRIASARFQVDPDLIPVDDDHWQVWDIDNPIQGPSRWSVADGVVTQASNIYQGSASDPDPKVARYGTLRMYRDGGEFADGTLEFEIRSADDDGMGIAFRLADPARHYLWAADLQRGFRVLAVRDGQRYQLLEQNEKSYQRNTWHHVRIVMQGPRLAVYVDGEQDFEVQDSTFARGTIALHSWGSEGVQFRAVKFTPAQ